MSSCSGSEEIRLGLGVPGGWLLGSCRRLLRCGLGRGVSGGWLLSCRCRLLRCGLCLRLEVRPADGNDQYRGGVPPRSERWLSPRSERWLSPRSEKQEPPTTMSSLSPRSTAPFRARRLGTLRSRARRLATRLFHAVSDCHRGARGPPSAGSTSLLRQHLQNFHFELGQRKAQLGDPHHTLRVARALPSPQGINPDGIVLGTWHRSSRSFAPSARSPARGPKALDDVCRWPGHRLRPDLLGDEHTLDRSIPNDTPKFCRCGEMANARSRRAARRLPP